MSLRDLFDTMSPGTIVTIAGAGYREGIPAKEADIGWPTGVVRRPDGDLVFGDIRGHRLWRIDKDGILHTFAGDGVPGTSGDGGPARDARVYSPHDLCQDKDGSLYFTELGARGPDEGPNTVRRIDYQTGIIARVVGSGKVGRGGDGRPALEAEMDTSCGVAVDDEGNIYVCHKWDSNVSRVDARSGILETFAGQNTRNYPLEKGTSRPFSGSRFTFQAYHGDGGPAREAALGLPEHLALDSKGDLYICDNGNNRIRKVEMSTGVITTVMGTGDPASYGDGGPATEAAVHTPDSIFIDAHDNLYVGEARGFRLRKVDSGTGFVSTIAGNGVPGWGKDDVPATETQTNSVEAGIWADPDGTVFYSDCSGRLRRVDADTGIVTTAAGGTSIHDGGPATEAFISNPRGIAVGRDGSIYVADMQHDRVRAIDPDTGIITTVAGNGGRGYGGDNGPATGAFFLNIYDVALDAEGRLVAADTLNGRVRRVETDGTINTIAGNGVAWDGGDGGPATAAGLVTAHAVATGPDGNLYVGDSAGRIRIVEVNSGTIRTFAGTGRQGYSGDGGPAVEARIGTPAAVRFDGAGNLYFADLTRHVIRRVDRDGRIFTVVGTGEAGFSPDGTPALEASLFKPMGLEVTLAGKVYFCDSRNNRVRTLDDDGNLQTVAGSQVPGYGGDGGVATAASLNEPHGLAFFGPDVLLVSDHYNNRIRAIKLG